MRAFLISDKTPRPVRFALIVQGHSVFTNDRATLETLAGHMQTAARICSEAATRE